MSVYDIKPVWYHLVHGKEQCQPDNLYNIDIATPKE